MQDRTGGADRARQAVALTKSWKDSMDSTPRPAAWRANRGQRASARRSSEPTVSWCRAGAPVRPPGRPGPRPGPGRVPTRRGRRTRPRRPARCPSRPRSPVPPCRPSASPSRPPGWAPSRSPRRGPRAFVPPGPLQRGLVREQHAQPRPPSRHAPPSASSERSAPVSSRSSSMRLGCFACG